jgi:hypothetical protein
MLESQSSELKDLIKIISDLFSDKMNQNMKMGKLKFVIKISSNLIFMVFSLAQCLQRDRLVTQLCLHIWSGGTPVLLACHQVM